MRETEETNNNETGFSKRLFVAYFSEFILCWLIIVYCYLSPSLFSTIALIFMMIAISVNITRIYFIDEKSQILTTAQKTQSFLQAYRLQKIIWIVFTVINIGTLFFKVIFLATNSRSQYTQSQQNFLQIQDLPHMFLPLIMLPFSIGSIFIKSRKKSLNYFRKQISETIKIPAYFLLGGLCILVQICSQSGIGLLYFFISLVIFWINSTSFQNKIYKVVVLFIRVCSIGTISISFLASTKLFKSSQWSKYYETIGIDGLVNFQNDLKSGGHFMTQIGLFFYCNILHKLFEYQKWNTKALQKIEQYSISIGQIFGQNMTNQSRINDQDSPKRTLKQRLLQQGDQPSVHKFGLPGKEYELKQLFREEDSNRRISLFPPMSQSQPKQRTWSFPHQLKDNMKEIKQESSRRQSSSIKSVKQKKKEEAEKKRKKLIKIWKGFLKIVTDIINFLNSSDFTLRVAELISIVIIQRYNNVYSFLVLVWLAMIASVENLKVVYLATAIVLLPMQVINYLIMFVYNIPHSFISDIQHKSLWGFQLMYAQWLDVIVFNVFLYYIILFVKAASKQTRASLYSKSKTITQPSNWVLAVAFIFRYTYLLTIAAMFFMGFSNPTLIDLGYVILFFLFFTLGQNLTLQQKIKKKKSIHNDTYRTQKVYVLTTLSRKFWFVIIYYTLTVIVLKYIYFLFFEDQATKVLDPIGINQIYDWAFNFSLTDVCKSNTTPFFIIFVLAESQIIIHRSNIYLNYSFSLIASSNERKLKQDREKRVSTRYEKIKKFCQKFICFCLEFYYQGLYYFGGIIILACSYSWNIVQVPLVILTCIGLLNKFNKKLLISIVSIDLLFIFSTYIFRFLNYQAVSEMFGSDATQKFKKIALFCGFNLDPNENLYKIIALSVVIVYFSVESYRLCHKLEDDSTEDKSIKQQQSFREQSRPKKKKRQLHQSQYEATIIDSQFQDKLFATRYQQGVIQATKTYYNTDLTKKYAWLKYTCKFFSFIIVDAVSIIVLVCCLCFRVSVSMFVFLVLYLIFYYSLFGKIGTYLSQINYVQRINVYLQSYNNYEKKLQNKQNPQRIEHNRQKVRQLKEFTHSAFCEILNLKYSWKKSIWIYSAILSVTCLVLTYAAQFIVSDFFIKYVHWQNTDLVQDVLFILGFSVNTQISFFRQVYFYYLMIIINVIEKLLIAFYEKEKEQKIIELDVKKQFKEILKVEDPFFLTDEPQISKNFIIEHQVCEKLCHIQDDEISEQQEVIGIDNAEYQKQVVSTCNLLIYFNYKQAQIKINVLYALLATMVRTYLWFMLINVYQRSSFSAFLYLFTLFYFWFKKIEFTIVKDINKAAIIIFLIQYLMLLFDIEQNTSPLQIPNGKNLSLLQKYITEPQWIQFLVIGQNDNKTYIILISFFINSIIIFVTELYFSGFQYISKLCIKLTEQIWDRYDYIFQTIQKAEVNQTLDLNYEAYKSWKYRVLQFAYENFITNFYVIVSILILLLLSADHTYISLIMLVIVFVYIYMARYTKYGNQQKIFQYTKLFFNIFRTVEFFFITLFVVFGVPVIKKQIAKIPTSIGFQITLSQIFLVLFIQLWLDCTKSQEFYRITNEGLKKNQLKEVVRLRCLAFQTNNKFMKSLIKTFQEIMTFQLNIKQAHQIIKEWENTFKVQQLQSNVQNSYQTSMIQEAEQDEKQVSQALKAYRNQIRRKIQRQEKQSEQKTILDKISGFLQRNTNPSLSFSYFELMQYILKNNKKVMKKILKREKIRIDIWDYNLQNYSKLEQQIIKCREDLNDVGKRILQDYESFNLDYFQMIIQEQYENIVEGPNETEIIAINSVRTLGQKDNTQKLFKVITPKKLNLIINKKEDDESKIAKKVWFFTLSNFNYFVLFLIIIYYTINPALLSFPLVLYIFSFYVVADKKYNNLIIIYLVIVIILAQLFQLKFLETSEWTAFFFYLPQEGTYHFSIGYLFFLFIIILIDEQIKKYQGVNQIHQSQVQSFQNASMRILANEQKKSDLYLWKMYFQDQEDYELINNPIFYAEEQISLYPQNLTEKPQTQFSDVFYRNKPGVDLYPYIATIQIFLTIYLIFFYPLMTLLNQSDLSQSFKYFTFSSNMIIAILAHVLMIVIERKITLIGSQNKHKEIIKFIFTMIIFALFLVFIYYWASAIPPNQYEPQPALIAFSFFYFFYFFLSGLQVKYGYKKFKKINSFMVKRNSFSSIFVLIFVAIPFLYEIKCIMDWTFLKTSLQLFDWFKLFSIYVSSFKAKIQQNGTLDTNLGQSINWKGKIIGWIGFTLLLLIIFGPMILFSGLNPTAQPNLVNGGSFQLGIHVVGGNEFTLYSTSHFSNPPLPISYQDFVKDGFNDVPQLKSLTKDDLPNRFQNISFQTYSDNFWGISPPNYKFLKSAFNKSTYEMENEMPVTYGYRMTINYILNRKVSQTTASITTFQFPTGDHNLSKEIVSQLNKTFHTCGDETTIPGLYNSLIRLITSGNTYKPSPIFFNDSGSQKYLENVTLKMTCVQNDAVQKQNTNAIYWEVSIKDRKSGIQMYVFADLYQSLLGGLSFTAIYTSVILVVAGFIRGFLAGNLPLIPYQMNAKPQKILQICEAIGIHRQRKQFKQQFLMYYELIDVIRSPEIIRKLGASYTTLIARSHRIRKYRQKSRQQKQKKKTL